MNTPQRIAKTMRLATWNINSLTVRLPQVIAWLSANPVDALCLQELKLTDDKFPREALQQAGYHSAVFGQKTYNGVAILSRAPVRDVVTNITGFDDAQSRLIAATLDTSQGPLRLINGYFVNGQEPASAKFEYKMRWLQALHDWLRQELAAHPQLVLLGDFNVAFEDRDSWDPDGLRETIHHTTQERAHFRALLQLGLHDSYRMFEQPGKTFSWWDYRDFAFRRNRGLRIDYILVSDALKARVLACTIDKAPRRNDRPSDHTPVVVELAD